MAYSGSMHRTPTYWRINEIEIEDHLGFAKLRSTFQDAPIACNFLVHFFLNLNLNLSISICIDSFILLERQERKFLHKCLRMLLNN